MISRKVSYTLLSPANLALTSLRYERASWVVRRWEEAPVEGAAEGRLREREREREGRFFPDDE